MDIAVYNSRKYTVIKVFPVTEDCFNHRLDENPQIDLVLGFFLLNAG